MSENAQSRKIEFSEKGPKRYRTLPLEYPLTVDGKDLKSVMVKRLTAREVSALQEAMDEQGFLFERLILPFTDQDQDVLDALDQDDFARIAEAVIDFLPESLRAELNNAREQMEAMVQQRLERVAEGVASELSRPGEASSPTSPTPSSGAKTSS